MSNKDKTASTPPTATETPSSALPFPGIAAIPSFDTFVQLTKDQVERVNAFYGELAQVEAKVYDRAREALSEAETMQRELSSYVQTLAGQWRKMVLDTTERTAQMWSSAKA